MIRALSISCLAIGFVLSAIQCLCGMSVQAEVCHVQAAAADCCCTGTDGRVTDAPPDLPPALAAASPRFSGPDSHTAPQGARSLVVLSLRFRQGDASHSDSTHTLPPLYLMKSAFLI